MQPPRLSDALGHGVADKRIDILRAIGRTGSISQAARDVAVSYKAAWQAVDTLTNLAGVPLVGRAVGGVGGGGASLTAQGQQLLDLADALDEARQAVQARWAARQGNAPGPAQAAYARLALRTSMRNQLPGLIATLQGQDRIARVTVQFGEAGAAEKAPAMTARITRESAELLGLEPGMPVVVLCKATAVRVVAAGQIADGKPGQDNQMQGPVAAVAMGASGDEVTLGVAGGLQLVGFAPGGSGLQPGQQALAVVDETAVVIALPG
jgi:molybdate transport system regulatory protein